MEVVTRCQQLDVHIPETNPDKTQRIFVPRVTRDEHSSAYLLNMEEGSLKKQITFGDQMRE